MRASRRFIAFVCCMLLQATLIIVVASPGYAASQYDNPRISNNLLLGNASAPCTAKDVTYNWLKTAQDAVLAQDPNTNYATRLESTFTNPATHYWGVISRTIGNSGDQDVIFFSARKSDTLDYYTFGHNQSAPSAMSAYRKYNMVVPFVFDNYDPNDSLTSFVMRVEENCSVAVDINQGLNGISGTLENYNQFALAYDALMQDYYPDNQTTLEHSIFFMNMPFQAPSGYAGPVPPASTPSAKSFVALGDSYASGEGNPLYLAGSDTLSNMCHRSDHAWPIQLEGKMDGKLDLASFIACSGAVNDYLVNSINNENVELPQAGFVSDGTDVVTVSIGGNDINFAGVLRTCMASESAQGCLDIIASSKQMLGTSFVADIQESIEAIRLLGGADTHIILVGYPNIYPAYEDISQSCSWGDSALALAKPNDVSGRSITEAEIDELRDLHDDLNEALGTAVDNVVDSKVHFVDPSAVFTGHEICGSLDDWLHGISFHLNAGNYGDYIAGSYHPNNDGMAAYANMLSYKMNELFP